MRLCRIVVLALVAVGVCGAVHKPPAHAWAGTIRLGQVEATAVATVPNPAKYEKLAADELVAYLERISGKRLKQLEIGNDSVPKGFIAVGTLASKAGLIAADELEPLARDGYVVRG
jgi:Flp pilus assembly protein CpaB